MHKRCPANQYVSAVKLLNWFGWNLVLGSYTKDCMVNLILVHTNQL